jgi:hypothetical protein
MHELKERQERLDLENKRLEALIKQETSNKQRLLDTTQPLVEKLEKEKASCNIEFIEKLKNMEDWYKKVIKVNQSTAQATIIANRDHVVVNCYCDNTHTAERVTYQVRIDINSNTRKMKDIMLIPNLVDIQITKTCAIKIDDVAFLLREIKHKIQRNLIVAAEVEVLKDVYKIEWNRSNLIIYHLDDGTRYELLIVDSFPGQLYSVSLPAHSMQLNFEQKNFLLVYLFLLCNCYPFHPVIFAIV